MEAATPKVSLYEQCRQEKIKENIQRMQNLGIFDLSLKLKSQTGKVKRQYRNSNSALKPITPPQPSRRSSRLGNTAPVVYTDGRVKEKREISRKRRKSVVVISEGPRAEVYTEEHEKLLGNTERTWKCFVDGCGTDGKRVYDPFKGKTCHQCRQKTLGHRTRCSECKMVQGQFCGDCLYMRYGEHVLEALENPNWVCPVCRGICNCSLCRNHKGWVPTGPLYPRIAELGYKSVAHYLIQTKRAPTDDATPNEASAKRSLSFQEANPLPEAAADDGDDLSEQVVPTLKKEEDGNPDSARRSLSFVLPSMVDVQEPPKQEDVSVNIGDDLSEVEDKKGDSYLLPGEKQTLVVYAQDKILLCNETDKKCTSVNEKNIEASPVSTRVTTSKWKASLEPNPDSIGARLRQRRRTSQSGL